MGVAAMAARNLAHQRQAQSISGAVAAVAAPIKRSEYLLEFRRGRSRAAVPYFQNDSGAFALKPNVCGRRNNRASPRSPIGVPSRSTSS